MAKLAHEFRVDEIRNMAALVRLQAESVLAGTAADDPRALSGSLESTAQRLEWAASAAERRGEEFLQLA